MKKILLLICFFPVIALCSPDTYIELMNGVRVECKKAEVYDYSDSDPFVKMGRGDWSIMDDAAKELRKNGIEVDCFYNQNFWNPVYFISFPKDGIRRIHEWHTIHDKEYYINGGR